MRNDLKTWSCEYLQLQPIHVIDFLVILEPTREQRVARKRFSRKGMFCCGDGQLYAFIGTLKSGLCSSARDFYCIGVCLYV